MLLQSNIPVALRCIPILKPGYFKSCIYSFHHKSSIPAKVFIIGK